MDPNLIIALAAEGINAAMKIIQSIKTNHGLTDEQVMAAMSEHTDATKQAVQAALAAI